MFDGIHHRVSFQDYHPCDRLLFVAVVIPHIPQILAPRDGHCWLLRFSDILTMRRQINEQVEKDFDRRTASHRSIDIADVTRPYQLVHLKTCNAEFTVSDGRN